MRCIVVTTAAAILLGSQAWASGGGSVGGGGFGSTSGSEEPRQTSPDQVAKSSYNRGVKEIGKAKAADTDAAVATDPGKKQKLVDKAQKGFTKARDYFLAAVNARSDMYQAWNYIGYTQRKLGNYDAALAAYDQALTYNPAYGEAIEYRGEAYLALNRIDDAKSAYMILFRDARPLAAELMSAMQKWIESRKLDAKGLSPDDLDAFGKWLGERAAISEKTALLGAGKSSASSWN